MTRRDRIAHCFSAASATYDRSAQLQTLAAQSLAARVLGYEWNRPRVLEVGCGTGGLTHLLLPRLTGPWLITDIAPAMLAACRQNFAADHAQFRLMDGEHSDLPRHSVDLIVSNLAVQWFDDLGTALPRLAQSLAPGGRLLLTTLGQGSLPEWQHAVAQTGYVAGTPPYPTAAQLASFLPGAAVSQQIVTLHFANGAGFLQSLKAIGATVAAKDYRPLPTPALRQAITALGAPCTASYNVLTLDWQQQ